MSKQKFTCQIFFAQFLDPFFIVVLTLNVLTFQKDPKVCTFCRQTSQIQFSFCDSIEIGEWNVFFLSKCKYRTSPSNRFVFYRLKCQAISYFITTWLMAINATESITFNEDNRWCWKKNHRLFFCHHDYWLCATTFTHKKVKSFYFDPENLNKNPINHLYESSKLISFLCAENQHKIQIALKKSVHNLFRLIWWFFALSNNR